MHFRGVPGVLQGIPRCFWGSQDSGGRVLKAFQEVSSEFQEFSISFVGVPGLFQGIQWAFYELFKRSTGFQVDLDAFQRCSSRLSRLSRGDLMNFSGFQRVLEAFQGCSRGFLESVRGGFSWAFQEIWGNFMIIPEVFEGFQGFSMGYWGLLRCVRGVLKVLREF